MDKLRILREFEKSNVRDILDTYDIRLYLVLLANSRKNGEGKVLLSSIKGVLGKEFSIGRLKAACCKLTECGLIEVSPSSLEQVRGGGSKLAYKVTPEKHRATMLKDEKEGAV